MNEPLGTLLARYLATAFALSFGDMAHRMEAGMGRSLALCVCIVCAIVALELWADRINGGRR